MSAGLNEGGCPEVLGLGRMFSFISKKSVAP